MQNKAVVATADNAENSLRSRRLNPAVPHFRRSHQDNDEKTGGIAFRRSNGTHCHLRGSGRAPLLLQTGI